MERLERYLADCRRAERVLVDLGRDGFDLDKLPRVIETVERLGGMCAAFLRKAKEPMYSIEERP